MPAVDIDPALADCTVAIGLVQPKPGNARRHDLADLKDSLRFHGQYRPIVANRKTGHIVKGNGTWQAMKELGAEHIAVSWVDVDSADETRMTLEPGRINLPTSTPAGGTPAIDVARQVYDENTTRQLVLPVMSAEYDTFLADLDSLTEPGENIALVVKRLVLTAAGDS